LERRLVRTLSRVCETLERGERRLKREDLITSNRVAWQHVSLVVDRLLLIVFTIGTITITLGVLFHAPLSRYFILGYPDNDGIGHNNGRYWIRGSKAAEGPTWVQILWPNPTRPIKNCIHRPDPTHFGTSSQLAKSPLYISGHWSMIGPNSTWPIRRTKTWTRPDPTRPNSTQRMDEPNPCQLCIE